MWRNPKYYPDAGPAEQPAPPAPTGELLAAFPRRGPEGVDQELRVVLDEYQGHRYLAIRLWQRNSRTCGWWPLKGRGVSVRLSEAEGVAEALTRALQGAGRDGDRPERDRAQAPTGRTSMGRGDLPEAPGIGSGPVGEDPGY